MKQILQTFRILIFAGLATACVAATFPVVSSAAGPSGDQFSIRLGRGGVAYSSYGRGRYGYRNGFSGNRNNAFLLYGRGPYGYQNGYQSGYYTGYGNNGYSGWNSNYRPYTPYPSGYYNQNSNWTYSPFGYGIQQSYGW